MKSRLDVVNAALEAIGQSPVESIDTSNQHLEILDQMITRESENLQRQGWEFNTEYGVTYSPDGDGFITVGDDIVALRYPQDLPKLPNIVLRGSRLYNATDNTYVFSSDLKLTQVRILDWDLTPEEFRVYIEAMIRRMAYQSLVGSGELMSLLTTAEIMAKSDFETSQTIAGNSSLFGVPSVYWHNRRPGTYTTIN